MKKENWTEEHPIETWIMIGVILFLISLFWNPFTDDSNDDYEKYCVESCISSNTDGWCSYYGDGYVSEDECNYCIYDLADCIRGCDT